MRNVTKAFGDAGQRIIAVDDFDLPIEDGEFLVLVGPLGLWQRRIDGAEVVYGNYENAPTRPDDDLRPFEAAVYRL